jgi:hypothetical protein
MNMSGDLWDSNVTLSHTSEWLQTHALHRGASGIGKRINNKHYSNAKFSSSNIRFITSYLASHYNKVYNVCLIK